MKTRGFTLIELMVVLAVLAIIAAIALPAFTEQMRKSRRSEAMNGLTGLQLREERWRANHANYLGTDSSTADKAAFGTMPTNPYYTNAITSAESPSSYTLTATRISGGPQAADRCGSFVLTNTNGAIVKSNSGSTIGTCW